MAKEDTKWCPLIKKNCIEKKCSWYMHVRGMNPNTGEDVDHWDCAVSWMPMLLIENSQQQRSTGAAVESFRNEMVKSHETNQQILDATANMYFDILESQGVNVNEYFEPENSENENMIDNKQPDLLQESTEEQK